MIRIGNPQPIFLDARGGLSDGGYIFVGEANADPESTPINVFWDSALTIRAEQPLRTIGGALVNGGTPASIFTDAPDYSMRLRDYDLAQAFYSPSIYTVTDTATYQPASDDLSEIAALKTTDYGRKLLTLTDQTALKTATGIPAPLPASGGTVTGDINRQGAGSYLYFGESRGGGRVFVTVANAPDPTSQVDDIWLELA